MFGYICVQVFMYIVTIIISTVMWQKFGANAFNSDYYENKTFRIFLMVLYVLSLIAMVAITTTASVSMIPVITE